LRPEEEMSHLNSTGISYSIVGLETATDTRFYFFRGKYKLYGYFAVLGYDGPFQGLFSCRLKALNVDQVL
jgi:hypothetical protein